MCVGCTSNTPPTPRDVRGIGEGEGLSDCDVTILSAAAILHDIGIPNAILRHGSAAGEFQEREGEALAPSLLAQSGMDKSIWDRVAWLVGRHHTEALASEDPLLQMLMEADYLVNTAEGNLRETADEVYKRFFKTETGKSYISALFGMAR